MSIMFVIVFLIGNSLHPQQIHFPELPLSWRGLELFD